MLFGLGWWAGEWSCIRWCLLFFIFGGVEAFGFLGLFLGPVVASVLAALFDILREELKRTSADVQPHGCHLEKLLVGQRRVQLAFVAFTDVFQPL